MALAKYAKASRSLALELIVDVEEADLLLLRNELASLSLEGWLTWMEENNQAILEYIRATPSKRKRNKLWRSKPLFWILAGWRYYIQADLIQASISSAPFLAGDSYRNSAADVIVELDRLSDEVLHAQVWPREWGEFPFSSEY